MASTPPALRYPGAHVATNGAKPAVIIAETDEQISYAQLDTSAWRMARLFASLGLAYGDHIAVILENRIACVEVNWGAHYAGLYYSYLSTRLTPNEIAYIVEDCDAKLVVLSDKTATSEIVAALRGLKNKPLLYNVDGAKPDVKSLPAECARMSVEPIAGAREGSEMLYSSGTTGTPKGIEPQLTDLPLGSTCMVGNFMSAFGMDGNCVYLSPAPFYHTAPLKWVNAVTAVGGTAILMERFDAEGALRAIANYRVTHSQWVPTMFHRLIELPDSVKQKYDLSSHRGAIHAAAPCPVPLKQSMIDWWGPIIYEYYGSTEGAGMTMTDSAAWKSHPGTVGRSIMGKVHIVNDAGEELPVGQEGLVCFSGGRRFVYHKDAKKTQEAYIHDDWATVGDIGKLDEDGFLYLTDRKSNMIITGGVNVYPQETENVLITHPKVFDVAVIGTPHKDFGEEVRAVVQVKSGCEPSEALAQELIAYCRERMSHIKAPRKVDFRAELPREPNGKLLKRLIRDEYRDAFKSATGEDSKR